MISYSSNYIISYASIYIISRILFSSPLDTDLKNFEILVTKKNSKKKFIAVLSNTCILNSIFKLTYLVIKKRNFTKIKMAKNFHFIIQKLIMNETKI